MNFARKQLEKYGWSEGKGLGKNEDGISTALKPKLKFDNTGVGHDIGTQFTNNWWEKLFNSAAENIDVQVADSNKVTMRVKSEDAVEITTSYSVQQLKKNKNLAYGTFIKTGKLTQSGMESYNVSPLKAPEPVKPFQVLTDEELFAACGGRTAHKGARHGMKLGGKLSRIEKQEKILLRKMKKVSLSDEKERSSTEKKLKKLKKQKEENREAYIPIMEDSMESTSSNHLKRKSNKKRKSVSFNETVTKIYTVDLNTSFDSEIGSIRDENSNEPILENAANGSDEGIEQDIENNNNDLQDNHRSFEEAQFNINDLSKAERKKLKKKRKLEAKRNTSTCIFLQKLNDNIEGDESMHDFDDKGVNLKKRKFLDDCEHGDFKRGHSKTESPDRNKSKKNKKKRKKPKQLEEKINSIVKSLDNFCRISESN